MKLSRIRVEQFKQFRHPIEIADLESGINLFTGPNEAGKSTLVAAIRAAFFERHRSSSVEELRPWGDSTASPTVELEFVLAGAHYRLTKSFLHKKRCELQIGVQRLDGAAAEDHLAELLGFQYAGRGVSAAEHWGIPGLLWMQQGTAQDIKDAVVHATDHLRTALNASLGEVVSSGGDDVLASVEAARNALLTPAKDSPRGELAESIKRETQLNEALQQLDADISRYRQKVDQLAALRRAHDADALEKPWAHCRELEQVSRDKLKAVQEVAAALIQDRQRAAALEEQINLARNQVETFASQEEQLNVRRAELAGAKQAVEVAVEGVEQWKRKAALANNRYASAQAVLRRVREAATRLELTEKLQETHATASRLATVLTNAEREHAKLLALQKQAASTALANADLETLRKQQAQLHTLQARLAAAATRVRLVLAPGQRVQIGEEWVTDASERLLQDTTTVTLPGLGHLEIEPGGTDLAALRREEKTVRDSYAVHLQRLGVQSLEEAEARARSQQQLALDIKACTASLSAFAPDGIDALRTARVAQDAHVERLTLHLAQLPAATVDITSLPSVAEAEQEEQAARTGLDEITKHYNGAQLAAGKAQALFDAAQRELAAAQAVFAAPDRGVRVAAANQALVDARAEAHALASRVATRSAQVDQARPDILEQDVARFRTSAEQHEKHFAERRNNLVRLEAELEAAGAQGLEEQRAELMRDLAQAANRADQLRRRAQALDYLLELLRDKRRAMTRRLQAPLQKHLNRHLQLLFPDAHLEIDEHLTPGPITRTGHNGRETGGFDALSFGAREQMGVISRLAYADLLKEAGRPTLIILDDALVHSDAERLAHMKRVLFDAATRHQILLFTCHPGNWKDLGVRSRPLRDFLVYQVKTA